MKTPLVVGVGNPDRGDDAIGPLVVRAIAAARTAELRDCTNLIDLFEGEDQVVIVDAMRSGRPPGTTTTIEAAGHRLEPGMFPSTHSLGVAESVEMARALGRLPARVTILAVEGDCFDLDSKPCLPVARAVNRLIDEIRSGVC